MFITSWTIDIRMNIQIWLLYRRYKSEWYNFWWATIWDIDACACKVWTLFGLACGQEECSQMMPMTAMMMMATTMMTDKPWLHRLTTDILSWAKNPNSHYKYICLCICNLINYSCVAMCGWTNRWRSHDHTSLSVFLYYRSFLSSPYLFICDNWQVYTLCTYWPHVHLAHLARKTLSPHCYND